MVVFAFHLLCGDHRTPQHQHLNAKLTNYQSILKGIGAVNIIVIVVDVKVGGGVGVFFVGTITFLLMSKHYCVGNEFASEPPS